MPLPPKPPPATAKQTAHERAQAKIALRAERQQQEHAKQEVSRLHAERRAIVDGLKSATASRKALVEALEKVKAENERWQTPNGNLGEMFRLQAEIEEAEKQAKECHRRWDELGVMIEEKHVEIAFGTDGDE